MGNNGELAGLKESEKGFLGQTCRGIDLTGDLARIAVDAISAHRNNKLGDMDLALDVGIAIRDACTEFATASERDKLDGVRRAVDEVLKRR